MLEALIAALAVIICAVVWCAASNTDKPETEPAYEPVYAHTVVLDPGHGGEYPGCVRDGTEEKSLTLEICNRIRERLDDSSVEVIMTREEDATVSLDERCEIANASGAALFVSIHANSFTDESVWGLESYFYKGSESGRALSDTVLAHAERAGIAVRYSREGDYQVIRDTKIPAILIETGYMTNPADLERLRSEEYQSLLAEAIAGAIIEYLGSAE